MAPQDKWVVKQVLSGDRVVLRGQPRGGPPPEITFALSNLNAPKLARRPSPQDPGDNQDQPFAWEAREFLRKKLIGKEVTIKTEYQAPTSSMSYGYMYFGKDENAENIAESIVREGFAEVRRAGKPTEELARLITFEEEAKARKAGKWSIAEGAGGEQHTRTVQWNIENLGEFVASVKGQQLPGIVEFVRDCSTLRVYLLPPHCAYVTIQLTGIKGQASRLNEDGTTASEPFAEEAKFFVECRLLHREVKVQFEGVSNQTVALATLVHPNGNISEMLLGEGFARCFDWTLAKLAGGSDRYRQAEKQAKEKRVRIWKDYRPPAQASTENGDSESARIEPFDGKVIEIVNGDALNVKVSTGKLAGKVIKVHLAGVRPPRLEDFGEAGAKLREQSEQNKGQEKGQNQQPQQRFRPLYDIPFMYQAREFLRKKLIGKKVNVKVDYVQPPTAGYPDRLCCTVTQGASMNIGEALVACGFATVVRYRQDDDNRPSNYDGLRQAEEKARAKGAGLHKFFVDSRSNSATTASNRMPQELPQMRIVDISGDAPRVRQYFPFFERAGLFDAVVEFVASASRMRIYVPKESCVATLLLAGVDCPLPSRPSPRGGGALMPAEPFGEEACLFLKEAALQHDVKVKVDSYDRGGNLIGWLFIGTGEQQKNMSLELVTAGFARVHSSAEKSPYFLAMKAAEEQATAANLKIWSLPRPEPEANAEQQNEPEPESAPEKEANSLPFKLIEVLNVSPTGSLSVRFLAAKETLKDLLAKLNADYQQSPPLAGAYVPRKGDVCAYRTSASSDATWERAKVDSVAGGKISIVLIDSARSMVLTSSAQLAALPERFKSLPPQAAEAVLAGIRFPSDEEYRADAISNLQHLISQHSGSFEAAVVSKQPGGDAIILRLLTDSNGESSSSSPAEEQSVDVGRWLLSHGFVKMDRRTVRKQLPVPQIRDDYTAAQNQARERRLNIWRYGDYEEDDEVELDERPFRR